MAFTNTPANVVSTQITDVALAAPAATFASGDGIGMRKPTVANFTAISTEMNSMNPWHDATKVEVPVEGLQNGAATLAEIHAFAGTYVQAYLRQANGIWMPFTGQTSDDETLLGLDYEATFNLMNDLTIKSTLIGEVSKATLAAAYTATDPVGVTWTKGEDGTKRLRPGVKSVTVGGAHCGALKECSGSIKNHPVFLQLGRPLSNGCEVTAKIVGAQMAVADIAALYAAIAASDTIIINFWNGESIKLTNLFGGKLAKINTVAGVSEFVYLDNAAEA